MKQIQTRHHPHRHYQHPNFKDSHHTMSLVSDHTPSPTQRASSLHVYFEKMHSLHNYILVLKWPTHSLIDVTVDLDSTAWQTAMQCVCSPLSGLGAHQVMVVLPDDPPFNRHSLLHKNLPDPTLSVTAPQETMLPGMVRIWNADGSEAKACGNGARCVFFDLWRHKDPLSPLITHFKTPGGWVMGKQSRNNWISVDQGVAHVGSIHQHSKANKDPLDLSLSLLTLQLSCGQKRLAIPVNMGNPHVIVFGAPPCDLPTDWCLDHLAFDDGANVSFAWIESPKHHTPKHGGTKFLENSQWPWLSQRTYPIQDHWRVMTWERGVGLTPACGSGSCAVAAAIWAVKTSPLPLPIHVIPLEWNHRSMPELWHPPYRLCLPGGDIVVDHKNGRWTHTATVNLLASGSWWLDL